MTTSSTFLRDDATFQPLSFNRATFGDASYNQAAGDQLIVTTVAFTSPRTITLVSAASVGAGQLLLIIDEAGAVSSTNTLTITVQNGQKLNGVTNGTFVVSVAGCSLYLESDGVSNWQFAGQNNFKSAYVNSNAVLTVAGNQTLVGGFNETTFDLGTPTNGSTVTPNPSDNLKQKLTNNVAGFTIAATAQVGDVELLITNGASAGTITFTGFTKQWTGDLLDTTNTHQFVVFIYGFTGGKSAYLIKAFQ